MAAARVARGQRGRAEPVREHAEEHGERDDGDGLVRRRAELLEREQREDQGRQPARAEPADEQDRVPVEPAPIRARATGTIRTTVRLSTA